MSKQNEERVCVNIHYTVMPCSAIKFNLTNVKPLHLYNLLPIQINS